MLIFVRVFRDGLKGSAADVFSGFNVSVHAGQMPMPSIKIFSRPIFYARSLINQGFFRIQDPADSVRYL